MRREPRSSATQRSKDAKEFLESANDNGDKERFKAAVDNAADAVIAANDAFTIFMLGEVASADHREAIRLHIDAGKKISENKVENFRTLLSLRHQLTYRPVAVGASTARDTVLRAKRFVRWVSKYIEPQHSD